MSYLELLARPCIVTVRTPLTIDVVYELPSQDPVVPSFISWDLERGEEPAALTARDNCGATTCAQSTPHIDGTLSAATTPNPRSSSHVYDLREQGDIDTTCSAYRVPTSLSMSNKQGLAHAPTVSSSNVGQGNQQSQACDHVGSTSASIPDADTPHAVADCVAVVN